MNVRTTYEAGPYDWGTSGRLPSETRLVPSATIWLILPELMCSFQRLSHACISTRLNKVKPRTAHYNSYNLLDLEPLQG
jgi:hypothetical protein